MAKNAKQPKKQTPPCKSQQKFEQYESCQKLKAI